MRPRSSRIGSLEDMADTNDIGFDDAEWHEVADSSAAIYERVLVPAVFSPWVEPMIEAVQIGPGDSVLDVACGTGVVARRALDTVGPAGSVTGLDFTPAMLEVARLVEPAIDWKVGDALDLPFADETFDAVLCQAGMMFFPDRVQAVREMRRVLRPGGRIAVLTWAAAPGQEAYSRVLAEHVSQAAAERYRSPWLMSDPDDLQAVMVQGGFSDAVTEQREGSSRFSSVGLFLESTSLLLAGEADPADLLAPTEGALAEYISADGALAIPGPANIATARKR